MKEMYATITRKTTSADWSLLTVRLVAGLVLTAHGAQQLFGAFGGPGLQATMSAKGPGGGGVLGLLVAVGLFFGGLGIMTGFLARFSAAANIVTMLGAIIMVHAANGFFLVNAKYQYVGGFEFNLLLIGLCLAVVVAGPGKISVAGLAAKVRMPVYRTRLALLVQ